MDNRRQNFGTVVTTEGMWMLGGLFESASDLPTRGISRQFNIPGKSIGHFHPMNNFKSTNFEASVDLNGHLQTTSRFQSTGHFQYFGRFSPD